MNGNEAVQVERGIIPRVVADIFQSVAEFEASRASFSTKAVSLFIIV